MWTPEGVLEALVPGRLPVPSQPGQYGSVAEVLQGNRPMAAGSVNMNPVVVVHGGWASSFSKDRKERVRQGVVRAATVGYSILKEGKSAVDAVEGAVTVLEDDPEFNAGRGSVLNVNGEVEMDASIMNGKDLSAGAVSAVRCIANPIKLARLVMEQTSHCFLTGQGAAKFAAAMGVPTVPEQQLVTERNIKDLEKEKHEKRAQKPGCQKEMLSTSLALSRKQRPPESKGLQIVPLLTSETDTASEYGEEVNSRRT